MLMIPNTIAERILLESILNIARLVVTIAVNVSVLFFMALVFNCL